MCEFDEGAEAVALGLIFAIVFVPLVIYMALSEGTMSFLVLRLVDTTISIFLALLWFNTFSVIVHHEVVHALFPYAEEVFAVAQVVILYAVVLVVAYVWRDKDVRLMTLGSCGAHYVAFAGISATSKTQWESTEAVTTLFGREVAPWASFLVCILGLAGFGLVFRVLHVLWTGKVSHDKLHEVVEEMELDIIGLTGSFAITQTLRHALTGNYPGGHLFLFELRSEAARLWTDLANPDGHMTHTKWQRLMVLLYSVTLTMVAVGWLLALSEYGESTNPLRRKCSHVTRALLIMCIAWGYLLWGEWTFIEGYFAGHSIIGQMAFAALATFCSLFLIICISGITLQKRSARHFAAVGIMGASLVAAWSWEHVFGESLDLLGRKYQVGYGGLVPKAVLSFVIPAAVLPVYVTYIKPKLLEVEHNHASAEFDIQRASVANNVLHHSEESHQSHQSHH